MPTLLMAFRTRFSITHLGPESVKDTDGNIIQEAPLPACANLRQRERSIHPSGVARRHFGILDFFNNQTVPSHQPRRRF
jgi:hypothetical protein